MSPHCRIEWVSIYDHGRICSLVDFARTHWLSKNDTRNPKDLLMHAEAICAAYVDKRLVSCAVISTSGEPDRQRDANYWLTMCVTDPHWRSQGIFKGLYFQLIDYCLTAGIKDIATYSEERLYRTFLTKQGWRQQRQTCVDHGWPVDVFVKSLGHKK